MRPAFYGPFKYSPIINRPPLRWPDGAHVALLVVPNVESFSLEERPGGVAGGKIPNVPIWAQRDYGNRVGVWRLMEMLDRYGIRGTVALNSDVCDHHPQIIEAGRKRQWEWMGHNQTNTRRLNDVPEEEGRIIHDTLGTIKQATGAPPRGWLGSGMQETWNTLDILAAEGVEYVCDWCNDDQPYWMHLDDGRQLIAMPYSYDVNDKSAFDEMKCTADEFGEMICRQFDILYQEGAQSGRVMTISLHPYLVGMPYRMAALDAAFAYICRHQGVWRATGSEIADHFRAEAPS